MRRGVRHGVLPLSAARSDNIKALPAEREPPIIVRQGRKRWYATAVEIRGPSRIVYSPDKPLDCGARLWVEVADGV